MLRGLIFLLTGILAFRVGVPAIGLADWSLSWNLLILLLALIALSAWYLRRGLTKIPQPPFDR